MYHKNYITYLHKELDFLKLLVSRFHEQQQINDLELGVAMQRTQEIYEHFLRMKLMPQIMEDDDQISQIKPVEPQKTEQKLTEKVQSEAAPQQIKSPAKEQLTAPAPERVATEPERDVYVPEIVIPVSEKVATFPAKTTVVVKPEKKAKVEVKPARTENIPQVETPKATILAEKLSSSTDFIPINETLAQQKIGSSDLSSKLQTSPLHSIAAGIGLNDKFLFIRELFKNDRELYDSTIKYLDAVDSLKEALEFTQRNFDWDENSETTHKFVNLIHRRHGGG